MASLTETLRNDKILLASSVHILLSVITFGILNYFKEPLGLADGSTLFVYVTWAYCYVSCFVFGRMGGWSADRYGFLINRTLLLVISAIGLLGLWVYFKHPNLRVYNSWDSSLSEAFARVGEELFFRGYVYFVMLKLFDGKHRPHLWAVGLSSIAFAAMHTHVFLPGNQQSLTAIFLIGLFLAFLRYWTGSILLAITIHCFLNGYLLAVLGGWALYAIIVLWSVGARGFKENVLG